MIPFIVAFLLTFLFQPTTDVEGHWNGASMEPPNAQVEPHPKANHEFETR